MAIKPQLLTLTEAAVERVRYLLATNGSENTVLRIGVRTQGCSGLSYHIELASEPDRRDEVVETGNVTVYVDPTATLYLIGSEMDYVEDKLHSGFVFKNPNESSNSSRMN